MTDLHFHCLPGVDDGPSDWDSAVALCRLAAEEGTDTIVATPHVLREGWINSDARVLHALVNRLNALLEGHPVVVPGGEVFFCADLIELCERASDGPIITLNRGHCVLIEFAAGLVPRNAEAIFHELSVLGLIPIIAHPERNAIFTHNPERLERLVALGAMAQVTAASVLGEFGRPAQDACLDFFDRGLLHLVASDAHDVDRRPPRLAAAREWVRQTWGAEAEEELFESNPHRVIGAVTSESGHSRS